MRAETDVTAPALIELAPNGTRPAQPRCWVPEAPVAFEFNGLAYAVMMATPADLDDFMHGFAIAEGLAVDRNNLTEIAVSETQNGWIVRAKLSGSGAEKLHDRARRRVAESSCGLCGMENLEELARPLPLVASHGSLTANAIFTALQELPARQVLGQATSASHAAAWCTEAGQIGTVREDVGRHNAIDKLVGALTKAGQSLAAGFILSTARCSYEIVEKAVRAGATRLVTISLPTDLAVERARTAGLSLWVLARNDSVLLVNDASAR